MKVSITRKIPQPATEIFKQNALEILQWEKQLPPNSGELKEMLKDADAAITMLSDSIDKELLGSCEKLKVIANYAVGFNNIDLDAAARMNIKVANTPDVFSDATAEFALTLLMACSRRLIPGYRNVLQGEWKTWEPQGFLGGSMTGKTLGIIGLGSIGRELARKAFRGLEMDILYCGHSVKKEAEKKLKARKVSLEELLQTSDFVSIHTPLTEETRLFINEERLKLLKDTAVIVNTARGDIIDQKALYNELVRRPGIYAGLDVTTPEPLAFDHELLQLGNCLILPHIGSATYEARNAMAQLCAQNIMNGLSGKQMITPVV